MVRESRQKCVKISPAKIASSHKMWKFKLRIQNNYKEGSKIEIKDYITE